jgi:cobalt/nickel transport system ATP-binding protein
MIDVEGVGHSYPNGAVALRDVSLRIAGGERVVLLGANGSGKSTLLKILNGLVFPTAGRYRFRGRDVTEKTLRDPAFARDFRRQIAHLFQNPDAMLFNPTIYDEIAFGLRQLRADGVDRRVREWAGRMGLDGRLEREPFQLSGGEKQKLCLAALLAIEPALLLLDEPTARLDPRAAGWLVDFLRDTAVTTLVTTHNLSLASELGDRTLILSEEHRLVFDGALDRALKDQDLLVRANLLHAHRHRHAATEHRHFHAHDWD